MDGAHPLEDGVVRREGGDAGVCARLEPRERARTRRASARAQPSPRGPAELAPAAGSRSAAEAADARPAPPGGARDLPEPRNGLLREPVPTRHDQRAHHQRHELALKPAAQASGEQDGQRSVRAFAALTRCPPRLWPSSPLLTRCRPSRSGWRTLRDTPCRAEQGRKGALGTTGQKRGGGAKRNGKKANPELFFNLYVNLFLLRASWYRRLTQRVSKPDSLAPHRARGIAFF